MACYNYYFERMLQTQGGETAQALQQTVLDVLSLTLTLFLTGGFENPFFTLYFFQVIIAWILLPPRQGIAIIALILACFALQGLAPRVVGVDMYLSEDGLLYMGRLPFHVVGAPFSFFATSLVTAYSISVIMRDLRQRERELQDARRRAEMELAKLDDILHRLDAGMLAMNRLGRVEWVNERVRLWFGAEGADEEIGCYRAALAARAGLEGLRRIKASENEPPPFFRLRLPTRGLGVRDFEIVVTPITDERGRLAQAVALILDVTDQKKTQERWAQAEKLAAIGQLAAGVAHEINTPLGTIRILAEDARDIVRQEISGVSRGVRDELEEALAVIQEQTERCKRITQGLLNVSRVRERITGPCDPNALMRNAVELTRHKLRDIQLEEHYAENLPMIHTDSMQVTQALCNLLINASDALETLEETGRIYIETTRDGDMILLRIEDNGAGIPREHMPHIFEPFFTTKPVGKGTGLGLYITYGAIKELGGRLEIESSPGGGASATVWLPIHHENNESHNIVG